MGQNEDIDSLIENLTQKNPLLVATIYLHPNGKEVLDKYLGKRGQGLDLDEVINRVKGLPSERVFITPKMRGQDILREGPNAFVYRSIVAWGIETYLTECWRVNE